MEARTVSPSTRVPAGYGCTTSSALSKYRPRTMYARSPSWPAVRAGFVRNAGALLSPSRLRALCRREGVRLLRTCWIGRACHPRPATRAQIPMLCIL